MPRKAMVITVLQATALWVLAYVIRHHALEHAWSPLENFQDAYRANRTAGLQIDGDRNDTQTLLLNATLNSSLNSTSNSTSSGAEGSASDEEAFYTKDVPKYIFKTLAIAILRYYWLIYLERLLPARPRVSAAAPAEKEDDESREEEVIRKWVESGRVRRASLNWCNTFGKWMLDLTVGNLWQTFLWLAMGTMMRAEWPWKGDAFDKLELFGNWATGFFGLAPIATLVAFILVPAHKRILFEAGADLAWKAFYSIVLHVCVPLAVQHDFVQTVLKNMTDAELAEKHPNLGARLNATGADEL